MRQILRCWRSGSVRGETSILVAINLADRPAECNLPAGFDAFTGAPVAGPTVLEEYEFRWVTAR